MLDSSTAKNSAFVTTTSSGSLPHSGSGVSNKIRRNKQTIDQAIITIYGVLSLLQKTKTDQEESGKLPQLFGRDSGNQNA